MSKKKEKKSEGRSAPVASQRARPDLATPWVLATASWIGLAVMAFMCQTSVTRAKNQAIDCLKNSTQLDAQLQAEQLRCKFYKQMYNECVAPIGEARR